MRLNVRVPATSANLGPGFDSLGLALGLYDTLEVSVRAEPGVEISITGEGADTIARDASHLVYRAIEHTFSSMGEAIPGLRLVAHNVIPHGRGLGSSGAAIASGVMAAATLLADRHAFSEDELLALATDLEGHPDNVAPALFGGMTIAWSSQTGPRFKKLSVHRGVSPIVLVPSFEMSTALARSLQPASVPHADAVFNVSRSALLVAALTQSPELMFAATEDRLHQDYRASAMPETRMLIDVLRAHELPAVVSGAGPSILVLAADPADRARVTALLSGTRTEHVWTAHTLAVDFTGCVATALA